ncbi:MAG TPA: hypothetical protein VGK50_04910 [Coriobacteriia bacterium]|jgi:tRNA(Ile2) C34 agmatinyltransferase TiaS
MTVIRAYVCFDDTDTLDCGRGTGKLVRWFCEEQLPDGVTVWGVARQQLLLDPAIPYTSHNSSVCAILDVPDASVADELAIRAAEHVRRHFVEGSDPGVCVACEGDEALPRLMEFGRMAARAVTTQDAAREAARGAHLAGLGGTNDGIIGAAAGVGLSAWGWAGRLVEFGRLREWPADVAVRELEAAGILVLPVERNVATPKLDDVVRTNGWLRPNLWGGRAAVPIVPESPGVWRSLPVKQPRHD